MDYTKILEEIYSEITPLLSKGKVAGYIPELRRVSKDQFGMAICTNDGDEYIIGRAEKYLSIQSVSKVFTFALAYKNFGEKIWKRVGREPSGSKFNAFVFNDEQKPFNPLINAGAIMSCSLIKQKEKVLWAQP